MVGENCETYNSQVAKMALKSSTIVGEIFEIYSQISKMSLKSSNMVG